MKTIEAIYEETDMFDVKLISNLEKEGIIVKQYDFGIDFKLISRSGKDYHIYIMNCRSYDEVVNEIVRQYQGFDPEYETLLRVDDMTLGSGDTPEFIADLYNVMAERRECLERLIEVLTGYIQG